jgi:hypothetical protein
MSIPSSYTNITKTFYGGQEYYYSPKVRKFIEVINILTSAGLIEETLRFKTINILVTGDVVTNKNISTTIDIFTSALTSNENFNENNQWSINNNGDSTPGNDPIIYDSTPVDYAEPNYELGEDTIPD